MSIRKLENEYFPATLREIPEPPKTLYIEGELPDPTEYKYIAVVGSRKYSTYGKDACEKIIEGLKGYPIVIVSGLALGIDTIAHKAALKANLKTIAIPGSGLDRKVLHPHSNKNLANEIVERGGALLSEYEPEYPAGVHTFPRRNRIMAGLCQGVLVIEAGEKSGTLITSRLATEYNRDVYTIPGSIFSPSSAGSNQLLKLGATPITSSADLLQSLGFETGETLVTQATLFADLAPNEQKVIEILARESLPRDLLITELDIPISEATTLLMTMEIKGLIKESLGEIRIS